jgi:hypothetical protein
VLQILLALDLAVAVAAGIPCLRRFAVSRPGRVLLYPAEDALHIVRRRLEGICAAAGVGLAELDVQVITAPSLRLDLEADRARLDETRSGYVAALATTLECLFLPRFPNHPMVLYLAQDFLVLSCWP